MRSVENRCRESSRPLTIYGVPVGMFLIYLVWCKFPTFMTLWICTGVLTFFGVIAHFGWSWPVLLQRLLHMVRGSRKAGRPWWYRRFYE